MDKYTTSSLFTEDTDIFKMPTNLHESSDSLPFTQSISLSTGYSAKSTSPPPTKRIIKTPYLKLSNSALENQTLSDFELAILKSEYPIEVNETQETIVNNQKGILVNREEIENWKGPIQISKYPINDDPNPLVITKESKQKIEYFQQLAIRYLKPQTPPLPSPIVINQESNFLTPPAPPVIIRQLPPKPASLEPLVIREAPPPPPPQIASIKFFFSMDFLITQNKFKN